MKKQIQLLGGLMVFIALLTMNSTAFADFVIKGGGTVVVMNGTSLTSNTNVTIESAGTLDNSGTVTLNANFTNNGIADLGTGSIVLSGSTMQEFGGSSVSEIDYLTVNNTGPGVTLSGSLRVDNAFTLADGLVDMADYSLTLGSSISEVLGTPSVNNMIVTNGSGELRKEYYGAIGTFVYPLGDNLGDAEWSPLELNVAGDIIAGDYIGASVKNEKHPNNNSYDHYLNRYWSITTNGTISALAFDATGSYVEADVVGTETNIREGLYISPDWFVYDPIDDAGNTITFVALSEGGDITGVEFRYLADFQLFLQGSFDYATPSNKLMRAQLQGDSYNYIPLTAQEAYPEYVGNEAVTSESDIPANAVDWILVELRIADIISNATSAATAEYVAGFLLNDGSLVAQDGISDLPFTSTIPDGQTAYFVIHHRNHIPVMSSTAPANDVGGNLGYDFTNSPTAVYGTDALVLLYDAPDADPDLYGLWAGDGNHDYIVTYGDKQPVDDLTNTSNDTGYHNSDTNMDGIVNYGDKQFIDDNITKALQLPY